MRTGCRLIKGIRMNGEVWFLLCECSRENTKTRLYAKGHFAEPNTQKFAIPNVVGLEHVAVNVLFPSTGVGVGRVVECSGERFIVPCPRPAVVNHSRILSGPHQVLPSSSLSPSERPQQGARRARATCERLACVWGCKEERKSLCLCVFISQPPRNKQ